MPLGLPRLPITKPLQLNRSSHRVDTLAPLQSSPRTPGTPMDHSQPSAWIQLLTMLFAAATGIWGLRCTVIALIGGTMPLIGIQTEGSFLGFAFMLLIGEPIVITIGY